MNLVICFIAISVEAMCRNPPATADCAVVVLRVSIITAYG